ncbi:hypothetical protein [Amycolatopsis sp. NPDC059657]|uniref:hypothetical protein n=1 Tax=Amycolatopsis sp. NPDC059657 TaxID=3346899 RepID=UPI003670CF9A
MNATILTTISHRDRSVLRAVAAGRCEISGCAGGSLVIDGIGCCDQFVGPRLVQAGLIAAITPGPVRLTESGRALLEAA